MTQTIDDSLQVNGELTVRTLPGHVTKIASFLSGDNVVASFTDSGIRMGGWLIGGSKLVITDDTTGESATTGVSVHAGGAISGIGFNRNVADGGIYNSRISAWQFTSRDDHFALEGYNGASANPLAVTKAGNVGIGTTNPGSKLVISDGPNGLSLHPIAIGFNRNVTDGAIYNSRISAWQFTARDDHFALEGYNGASANPLAVTKAGNVGIGTTNPSQRLTLGSGNILLPNANRGGDGNLYFGGTTDTGQVGLRLFGGNVNNGEFLSGFIDVRAGTPTDGLIFRVDTANGGTERMRICADGAIKVPGDIILQNADCAEEFAVQDCEGIEPGTVMVLGQEGSLRPSTEAYDKKVAGVISGAGDLKPGLILDKQPESTNRMPVALMGKVNCKVDAQYAPIEVGDLLTTSPTSGHAMKATDPAKAFGTVIGKALKPLMEGTGLIPILAALQ